MTTKEQKPEMKSGEKSQSMKEQPQGSRALSAEQASSPFRLMRRMFHDIDRFFGDFGRLQQCLSVVIELRADLGHAEAS